MTRSSFAFICLIAILSLAALTDKPEQLRLKESLEIVLAAGQNRVFTLKVPPEVQPNEELYIHASPTLPDPFQLPYLTINSTQSYQENCYYAHSSFSSYCKISTTELKAGREFHVKVSCVAECKLIVVTQLSDVLTLGVGQDMRFTALEASGLTTVITVPVSSTDTFSSLSITALITNLEGSVEYANEGVQMFVNYGEKTVQSPTEEKFMIQAYELYSGGRIAFVDKQKLPQGGTLKVLLKLKKWISVVLSVSKQQGNVLSLNLGQSYYQMIKKDASKVYVIDNSKTLKEIQNKTVEFVFDFFAGRTQIALGFDDQFKRNITLNNKYSAASIEITPELRETNKYEGLMYVKVQAQTDTEFYFYTQLTREDATYLKPYTAYFDELEEKQLYNYIFDQRHAVSESTATKRQIRQYTFKVDIASGKGRFYFTRCQSLEMASASSAIGLDKCLKNAKDLVTIEFIEDEIQVKTVVSGSLMTINMQYDISNCPTIDSRKNEQNQTIHYKQCAFQIIAQSLSTAPWVYNIYAERKYHLNYLKENKMVKEYLAKDTYANFAFSLPSYNDIEEINIFSVSFSGKSVLLVSQADKLPTLYSDSKDVRTDTGSKSSIIIKGEQLKEGEIYISIYAQTFNEVNLGVLVHRKAGKTKEIALENGNSFPYTFGEYQNEVKFKFVVKNPSNISVNLNELVGLVTMQVFYENQNAMKCVREGTNRSVCRFQTNTYDQVLYAVVSTSEGKRPQFTISFSDGGRCKTGILNHPTFVELVGQTVECFIFNANRPINLKYIDSINNYMIAQKDVKVQLAIGDDNFAQLFDNSHMIAVRDMISVCHLGRKSLKHEFLTTCGIKLRFSSETSSKKNFNFVLQQMDKEVALFDGITEIVTDVYLYGKVSQYFYFKISAIKTIKIFISSDDVASDFLVVASVVQSDSFIKRSDDQALYPGFISQSQRKNVSNGIFLTDVGKTGTAVLSITSQHLKSLRCYEDQCYLLVTVTPDPSQNEQNEANRGRKTGYELQITQTESSLQLGDTKTGFVSGNNIDSYIISPEDSLISLRNLQNQDIRNGACARLMGALANGSIVKYQNIIGGSYLELKKSDQIEHIIIKPIQPKCSYQITYSRMSAQVHSVKLSQPYPLKLETGESLAFVYYHNNDVSFKIVKSISAGKVIAYLMPLKDNVTLTDALNLPPASFPIVDEGDRQHFIQKTHPDFCFNCIYLMVVVAPARFVGEIVFLRSHDPIPLSTNHALKEWLLPKSQWAEQTYIYYSVTDFNLTFEVITGKILVIIRDPSSKVLFNEELTEKKTYLISANGKNKDVEFYSKQAQYIFQAVAVGESEFYIKIDKNKINERIFEGLPASFNLTTLMPLAMQFVNSEQEGLPISLMLETKNNANSNLNFTITVEDEKGNVNDNQSQLVLKKVQAEYTYILNLLSTKGHYFVTVSSATDLSVTVLLVRKELTHLSPFKNYFFNKNGVYQIFTGQKNVLMELFNCVGDFNLLASKNIKDTQAAAQNDSKSITLRRPNYGGHYVIGVEGIFGSYFMSINAKQQKEELEYLLSYQYYEEFNPYNLIDVKNYEIAYKKEPEGYRLKINLPQVLQESAKNLQIKGLTVAIYASNSRPDLIRYSRCGIKASVVQKVVNNSSEIFIEKSLLQQLNTPKDDNLYFIAEVKIDAIVAQQPNPSKLTLLYDVLQISTATPKKKYWFTDSLFLLAAWLILPFLLAGALLFYLLKFCMRKLMNQQANMVEQEIVAESKPTVPSAAKLDGATEPESAKTMGVKEHI